MHSFRGKIETFIEINERKKKKEAKRKTREFTKTNLLKLQVSFCF